MKPTFRMLGNKYSTPGDETCVRHVGGRHFTTQSTRKLIFRLDTTKKKGKCVIV